MSIYVADLHGLHRKLVAQLGDFPLFAETYLHWFDAILNFDDEDELNYRLRDDAICYTTFEIATIENLVMDYITISLNINLNLRDSYTIAPAHKRLIIRYVECRKDLELQRLRNDNMSLREENHSLTLRLEEYEE